jgi:acetyl-CoA carboxylase biotin carboxylase subunit
VKKVLIANRGEIALRVIRACRELELRTVAVYSEPDEQALHVRRADEAVCIGKAAARHSYLNIDALLSAARETRADAIHPGYGFLSESPQFAAACEAADVTFIGPSARAIEQMGDKSTARSLARDAGVPTVPGSERATRTDDLLAAAEEVGYPVMIKAVGGGGGRGIRVAEAPDELSRLVAVAGREAEAAFGDASLYLEKFLEDPRHVEVQVLADDHGNAVHLYERECSLQRRRQKILEEAPAPALRAQTQAAICESAVRLATTAGYTNAGTVEFLLDEDENFYFIEMNARLQVEHGITEMITGVDLVRNQLLVAAGEKLDVAQSDVAVSGTALEFRINAEDPEQGFFPSPGEVVNLVLPGGPGVRVDTALYSGYTVVPFYDSLICKLIVWAPTRDMALARGRRALEELEIDGIKTSVPLHLRMLDDPNFRAGFVHTGYLEQLLDGARVPATAG